MSELGGQLGQLAGQLLQSEQGMNLLKSVAGKPGGKIDASQALDFIQNNPQLVEKVIQTYGNILGKLGKQGKKAVASLFNRLVPPTDQEVALKKISMKQKQMKNGENSECRQCRSLKRKKNKTEEEVKMEKEICDACEQFCKIVDENSDMKNYELCELLKYV
jgi:hypothetical protein